MIKYSVRRENRNAIRESSVFFLKTVSLGNKINFFVRVGFIDFSIRFQRYKNRKFLGGIEKDVIKYSVKRQNRNAIRESSLFFLKTVSHGNEINFFVRVGFIDFSIRIQRYENRKFLGGIDKDVIKFSVRRQNRNVIRESSVFFVKNVSFGKEINFSVHAGVFNFLIRIQCYKNRKFLGGILKVVINYSVKGHKRSESASELCSSLIFTLFQIDFWNFF